MHPQGGQGQQRRFQAPHAAFDVVALAASAGGLGALKQVLSQLPARFPAAIVVVQHLYPSYHSRLAEILAHHTALVVKQAKMGALLHSGTVYVAPPDRHLLVNPAGTLRLSDSAPVNFVRPAADCLFESVALSYKRRAIAVVLTGTWHDGATGIRIVKQQGGVTIAQDEATSEFFGMPDAAIRTGAIDYILPLEQIAPTLVHLVTGSEKSLWNLYILEAHPDERELFSGKVAAPPPLSQKDEWNLATHEEWEPINKELQFTNEALATMPEELHITSREVVVRDELQRRSQALNQTLAAGIDAHQPQRTRSAIGAPQHRK